MFIRELQGSTEGMDASRGPWGLYIVISESHTIESLLLTRLQHRVFSHNVLCSSVTNIHEHVVDSMQLH
jgi:hypothetical protein